MSCHCAMSFTLTAEQEALRARARELADRVFAERAARWDAARGIPWDNVKDLVAAGFMGMTIPARARRGRAARCSTWCSSSRRSRARAASRRGSSSRATSAWWARSIAYGTEAQKRRYFPWVLEGEKPAIAITEPEAGSAATDLATRADETPDGLSRSPARSAGSPAPGRRGCYLVYCALRRAAGRRGHRRDLRRARHAGLPHRRARAA